MEIKKEVVLIFLVILFVWWVIKYRSEGFNTNTTEFVPVGHDRYGLRGDLLRRSDIARTYINPDRNIRINNSGGMMYASNATPCQEGISGCSKIPCPCGNKGYDAQDTCWTCDRPERPTVIPDIHPHVRN